MFMHNTEWFMHTSLNKECIYCIYIIYIVYLCLSTKFFIDAIVSFLSFSANIQA
jgi:hypothetical protein